jgi:DNA-binding Lrp family transcriptional regulator
VDTQIVKALEAAGGLTTRQLANRINASRDTVYKHCKRLERDGRLTSELVGAGEKSIYFFPMTREVVTSETYERIDQLNAAVGETIRAYSLPHERRQLVAALEVQFEQLAEATGGSHRGALEEFASELLEAAAIATKRGDLTSLLGIRPMRPPARVWTLGSQLSLA